MTAVMLSAQADIQNIDELKVRPYTLPDPLVFAGGSRVRSAKAWRERRRPEIFRLFETQMFGRSPGRPAGLSFEPLAIDDHALGGSAIRKQIRVYFSASKSGPRMDLLLYIPARTPQAPVFLGLNFRGNQTVHSDPSILPADLWNRTGPQGPLSRAKAEDSSRGAAAGQWQVEKILSRGYALATVYAGDIEPDFANALDHGVRSLYIKPGENTPSPDEWGALAAWGWGLSRALDYLETDTDVDAHRVAVIGHSRMGKAALWAGARDPRFAMVISNDSGKGGAALSKRNFGETVLHLNRSFPHWFCGNYKQFSNQERDLPMDQHELIALIAPRPVYIATADQDIGADLRGQFLAAVRAGPVYRLLGKRGLDTDRLPPVEQPIMHTIGFHIRAGKHDMTAYDWDQYLEFAARELRR